MIRHVHFCCIGERVDPAMTVNNAPFQKDMLYLINSPSSMGGVYQDVEEEVRRRLKDSNFVNVETIHVDPYDFDAVYEALERILSDEIMKNNECQFHFNITAGSNICAGAMCLVAMSSQNSDIYHARAGRYCHPPVEGDGSPIVVELADFNSVKMLESKPKEAMILELIAKSDYVPHKDILDGMGMSPSLLSYHLKNLLEFDLIARTGSNGRSPDWRLTEKGRKVLRRYRIRNRQ